MHAFLLIWVQCLLLAAVVVAATNCPSNGNTHAIYVTSNAGDNIWSFDTQGKYLGEVLDKSTFPSDVVVDKLRAMRMGPGGHLYISSARGSYSRIFAVSGNGVLNGTLQANCTRRFLFTVVQQDRQNMLLDHPYDMVFHPKTHDLFVSNQNTVTVTKYTMQKPATAGRAPPKWVPIKNIKFALLADKDSAQENSEGGYTDYVIPDGLSPNAGVFAAAWSKSYVLGSVRGMALSPPLPRSLVSENAPAGFFSVAPGDMVYYLLVCDVVTNTVHVFDSETGKRMFGLNVPSPVQVTFPLRFYTREGALDEEKTREANGSKVRYYDLPYVFVTSKDDAMTYMVRFSSRGESSHKTLIDSSTSEMGNFVHHLYSITHPLPLHAGSGIYENSLRETLLLADRTGRSIRTYASPFVFDYINKRGPTSSLGYFVKQLPDQPEFIFSAHLENQANIPFCYELASDGHLHYVALCTAGYIWSAALLLGLIILLFVVLHRKLHYYLCARNHPVRREEAHAHHKSFAGYPGAAVAGKKEESKMPLLSALYNDYGTAIRKRMAGPEG